MAEKDPSTEIMLYPERAVILDGLGYGVMSLGGMPSIDSEGRKIVTFQINQMR